MRISRFFFVLTASVLGLTAVPARADTVTFDFDSAPAHAPLPIDQTIGTLIAQFSSSSSLYNYAIQPANSLGFTPVGFAGNCIYPSTINASDLKISFNSQLSDLSLLYAPEEYATDSSCTMRITAYLGTTYVGTNTFSIDPPGTWPSGTLSLSSAQPFDNVVVHYDKAPVTGGDYGPIFMVDNVTVTSVPEPAGLAIILAGLMIVSRKARGIR